MKHAIFSPLIILGIAVPVAVAMAGEFSPTTIDGAPRAAPIVQAAFGDGPATGRHHGRHRHGADTPKDTGPSKIDMHGATREGADADYRKKYGF